jgi:hypothetical protein
MSVGHVQMTYRLWIAFAVVPIVDFIIGYVGLPLVAHGANAHNADQIARSLGSMTGFLGLLVTVFGAMPTVLWLIQRGPVSFRQVFVAGLILGNVPFALFATVAARGLLVHLIAGTIGDHLVPISELIAGNLSAIAIGSIVGGISATVFWCVWRIPSSATPRHPLPTR